VILNVEIDNDGNPAVDNGKVRTSSSGSGLGLEQVKLPWL
jgi:hypothetical protein